MSSSKSMRRQGPEFEFTVRSRCISEQCGFWQSGLSMIPDDSVTWLQPWVLQESEMHFREGELLANLGNRFHTLRWKLHEFP